MSSSNMLFKQPRPVLYKRGKKKLDELKREELKARSVKSGDGLRPISRDDFVKEVNEASKRDIEGDDEEGKGTGIVCFLFKDGLVQMMHASHTQLDKLNLLIFSQPLGSQHQIICVTC
jgi:hypothetical protein